MKTIYRTRSSKRGFTLLIAALTASIVLALGAAIFSIAQKQLTLSAIGRDSQFAFYAADTAVECALYWDFRYSFFATSTPSGVFPTCDQAAVLPFINPPSAPFAYPYTLTTQQMDLFLDAVPASDYCAQVTVSKSLDPVTNAVKTVVRADGYSTSCATITTNTRALQRSVELRY